MFFLLVLLKLAYVFELFAIEEKLTLKLLEGTLSLRSIKGRNPSFPDSNAALFCSFLVYI